MTPGGDVAAVTGPFATTPEVLAEVARRHPDREAFVDGARRMTFARLERAAGGLAGRLRAMGVGCGDVVCLVLPSSIDYAVAYHACMRIGAITSGINPRLGPAEVSSILDRTEPVVTIAGTEPAGGCGRLLETGEAESAWEDPPADVGPALAPSDPAAIVWTSGTTGVPKGAVFDHGNLRAVADGVGVLSMPGDRKLSPLPFAHVGFMTRPWDELRHVVTTVIVPTPWRAEDALRLIATERVSVAQGVPAQWALMLAHPAFGRTDVSSLRLAGTGAALVPPDLVAAMRERLGCPVVVRYTSTEAALTTGTSPGDADDVVANTVGVPAANVEVELVDDDGRAVPAGEVGTVRVRSGCVMRGYWRDPDRTSEVLSDDGWLLTGDLGWLDERGNLHLAGRRSEMYIRGGYNVYPAEVEAALSLHPAVARVAVLGRPDPVLGEVGVAAVVPAAVAPQLDELRAWCRERLADYKAPDRLVIVEDLPLTAMSKVDKAALAAMLDRTSR